MGAIRTNLILLILLLLPVSCTTTQEANQALVLTYVGEPADSFFIQWGPPSGFHQLDSGGKLYLWSEKAINYNFSGTSNTTFNAIGSTVYSNTTTTPGSSITVQCVLKIITNDAGTITAIQAHQDTIGEWQMSRCNEVFNRNRK